MKLLIKILLMTTTAVFLSCGESEINKTVQTTDYEEFALNLNNTLESVANNLTKNKLDFSNSAKVRKAFESSLDKNFDVADRLSFSKSFDDGLSMYKNYPEARKEPAKVFVTEYEYDILIHTDSLWRNHAGTNTFKTELENLIGRVTTDEISPEKRSR